MKATWRRREDVSTVRFILTLLAAPLFVSLAANLTSSGNIKPSIILPLGTYSLWFLTVGLVFDLCVARHRGRIGLWDCLAVGLVAGATIPGVLAILGDLLPNAVASALGFMDLNVPITELLIFLVGRVGLIAAALTSVTGLIAGGIVWWVAVKPAPRPVDLGEVFR
jgi:hypothetical protein